MQRLNPHFLFSCIGGFFTIRATWEAPSVKVAKQIKALYKPWHKMSCETTEEQDVPWRNQRRHSRESEE